jgi:hypothetical protein
VLTGNTCIVRGVISPALICALEIWSEPWNFPLSELPYGVDYLTPELSKNGVDLIVSRQADFASFEIPEIPSKRATDLSRATLTLRLNTALPLPGIRIAPRHSADSPSHNYLLSCGGRKEEKKQSSDFINIAITDYLEEAV